MTGLLSVLGDSVVRPKQPVPENRDVNGTRLQPVSGREVYDGCPKITRRPPGRRRRVPAATRARADTGADAKIHRTSFVPFGELKVPN